MATTLRNVPPLLAVLVGACGLAAAMGIGRFAFTPLLPLMQASFGVTLAEGGWLAGANYAGYLVGALLCLVIDPPPGRSARWGLIGVAVTTAAMGLTTLFPGWLMLRFLAGMASAFVLVGISAWSLSLLENTPRSHWSGWIFAGVGLGIVLAGVVGLAAGITHIGLAAAWIGLGLVAALAAALAWGPLCTIQASAHGARHPLHQPFTADQWRIVLCYGAFGFGYIIPATFLPALARGLFPDPAVFGWIWPVFGAAAAVSTAAASRLFRNSEPTRVWACAQWVMAIGVAIPALTTTLWALLLSAICIGGTFMVLTMAGMQEARRAADASASRLMAAIVASFALGQLIGPLAVSAAVSHRGTITIPSLVAAVLLIISAVVLQVRVPVRTAAPSYPASQKGKLDRAP